MKTIGKVAGIVAAVALIATGVGAALGGTMVLSLAGTTIAASTIASVASAVAMGASLLAGKPKMPANSPENQNRLRATIEPRTFRKSAIGGPTALATDIRDEEFTGDQEYLHRFIVCASHEVHSIDEIWFDDKQAWTLAGGVQGEFVGYLTVDAVPLGNTAYNISPRMGDSRKFTGLANVHLVYKLTGNTKKTDSPFAQGITSRITIRGRGAKLYDPRLDSTAGGSGAHRADDQDTWEWDDDACNNPALALLFYLLGWRINGELAVGKGIPPARIDLASFAAAANICDEMVTAAGGGTEPRYRCAGVWSEGDSPTTVIDMLKACMNADLDDVDGKLRLTIFTDDTFASDADFTADDVLGAFEWTPFTPLDQSFNIISGSYTDPSDTSLYQQVDYPRAEATSPDGIDRIETLNLPMVQSPGQAQRLAMLRLQRQQFGGTFSAEFQATAWRAQKNSIVRLTFPPLGFVNKTFRVAEMDLRVDGVVPLVLREEDPDIYTAPAVTLPPVPVDNSVYDPSLDPLIDAIESAAAKTAQVFLFQRTATDTPPDVPSVDTTFTFATGVLSGADNGWTQTLPSTGGAYRWMTTAIATGSGATDTIPTGEWATPAILAEDGAPGDAGPGALQVVLSAPLVTVPASSSGTVLGYSTAAGTVSITDGTGADQSADFTLSTGVNPQALTMAYTGMDYEVTAGLDAGETTGTVEIVATGSGAHAGEVYRQVLTVTKTVVRPARGRLSKESVSVLSDKTGAVTSYATSTGSFVLSEDDGTAITTGWTLSTGSNPQGLTVSYSGLDWNVYGGLDAGEQEATVEIIATGSGMWAGQAISRVLRVTKHYGALIDSWVNANEDNALTPDAPTVTVAPFVAQTWDNGNKSIRTTFTTPFSTDPTHKNSIDGVEIVEYRSTSSAVYAFDGSDPNGERRWEWFMFPGTTGTSVSWPMILNQDAPANLWYQYQIRSIRTVNVGVNASGLVRSAAVTTAPFRPATTINWAGHIGGVASSAVSSVTNNYLTDNDGNATVPNAATGLSLSSILHTDSTAAITLDFTHGSNTTPGDYDNIDGYIVGLYNKATGFSWTYDSSFEKQVEWRMILPTTKAQTWAGKPANRYYWAVVIPFRRVRRDVDLDGLILGPVAQTTAASPHTPSFSPVFNGYISTTSATVVAIGSDRAYGAITSGGVLAGNTVVADSIEASAINVQGYASQSGTIGFAASDDIATSFLTVSVGTEGILVARFVPTWRLTKTGPVEGAEYSMTFQVYVERTTTLVKTYSDTYTVKERWDSPTSGSAKTMEQRVGVLEHRFTGLAAGTYNVGFRATTPSTNGAEMPAYRYMNARVPRGDN